MIPVCSPHSVVMSESVDTAPTKGFVIGKTPHNYGATIIIFSCPDTDSVIFSEDYTLFHVELGE
jgi:hypothetical protein